MKTHTQLLRRFIATLLFSILVLAFPNSPAANSFSDGVQAYNAKKYQKAFEIFKALAEQGSVDGQYNLGLMYGMGDGVSQDYAEAVKWYKKAAEQGDALAQYNLGVNYNKGQGVPQDYAEAVKWYRKAAEQGNVDGQYNLGLMYDIGQGVPQDYVQAHKWVNLSVSRSQGTAHEEAVQNRDWLEIKMTPAQVAEAQKLAREWKPKPNKSP